MEIGERIQEKAIQYAKNDNAIEFFGLFFNIVEEQGEHIYIETWIEGYTKVAYFLNKNSWKEDFCDISINNNDAKENAELHNWLVSISKLINGELIHDDNKSPTERNCGVFVLTFDKGHYRKHELDDMSIKELYETAQRDHKKCHIHTAEEYEYLLNSFKPLEKYVWTYIIKTDNNHVLI